MNTPKTVLETTEFVEWIVSNNGYTEKTTRAIHNYTKLLSQPIKEDMFSKTRDSLFFIEGLANERLINTLIEQSVPVKRLIRTLKVNTNDIFWSKVFEDDKVIV